MAKPTPFTAHTPWAPRKESAKNQLGSVLESQTHLQSQIQNSCLPTQHHPIKQRRSSESLKPGKYWLSHSSVVFNYKSNVIKTQIGSVQVTSQSIELQLLNECQGRNDWGGGGGQDISGMSS